MAEETCPPLISGVQSTDFSRVFCLARKHPTKVGTLYAVKSGNHLGRLFCCPQSC